VTGDEWKHTRFKSLSATLAASFLRGPEWIDRGTSGTAAIAASPTRPGRQPSGNTRVSESYVAAEERRKRVNVPLIHAILVSRSSRPRNHHRGLRAKRSLMPGLGDLLGNHRLVRSQDVDTRKQVRGTGAPVGELPCAGRRDDEAVDTAGGDAFRPRREPPI
jgi:hypothetical protein